MSIVAAEIDYDLFYPTKVDPTFVSIELGVLRQEVCRIHCCGEEYDKAVQNSKNLRCSLNLGSYGSGLANSYDDPRLVERYGSLGELAVAKVLGIGAPFYCKVGGELHDFLLFGRKDCSVDVKMRSKKYPDAIVYAYDEFGRKIPLESDFYVFGYIEFEDISRKQADVVLVGFATREEIEQWPVRPAFRRDSKHKNYCSPFSSLKRFSSFYRNYAALEKQL